MTVLVLKDLQERPRDPEAWEKAYRRLRPIVYRTAYTHMHGDIAAAEDVTQEAFLRFLEYTNLRHLKSDEHLLAYLRQTVRHLCWDRKRKEKLTTSIDVPEAQLLQDTSDDGEEQASLASDLEQLMGALSDVERRLLHELIKGSELADIAKALDITYGAAVVRAHRLRAKIRRIISDLHGTV